MKKLFKRKSRNRIWWFDVIYPFLLSSVLFSTLTYIIYYGEKHRSIAAHIEESFINYSLRLASPREIVDANKIVTITLNNSDILALDHYIDRGYTDAAINEYSSVIRKLIEYGAKYIVLNWQHGQKNESEYKQLINLLKEYHSETKVIFAVQQQFFEYIPQDLRSVAEVMESDPCQQLKTQIICVYQAHWEEWVIQEIVRDVWKNRSKDRENQVVSLNLPRIFPGYILHFNDVDKFDDYSFADIKQLKGDELDLRDKLVFVGNGLVQNRLGRYVELGRVKTVMTPKGKDPRVVGTPYHKFWAQIAQLFVDDDLIKVLPAWFSFSLALIFAIVITLCLAYLGALASLCLYLSVAFFASPINAFFIHFLGIYIPVFDIIYAGMTAFLLVTFAKLSLESLKHWRLSERQREDEELADVKGNFISLVSHNLNTPVAKMQGMLEILLTNEKDHKPLSNLRLAYSLAARMQMCIKAVLITTAIEDGRLNHMPVNLDAIMKEFSQLMGSPLKKIGIRLNCKKHVKNEDLALIPLSFDNRALANTIGSLVVLFSEKNFSQIDVDVIFSIEERQDQYTSLTFEIFVCRVNCKNSWLANHIISDLKNINNNVKKREFIKTTLLEEVSIHLIERVSAIYSGEIMIDEDISLNRTSIELSLKAIG